MRNFGLKVGVVGTVKFEARIKELVESFPDLVALVEPLLVVCRVLREQVIDNRWNGQLERGATLKGVSIVDTL